MLHLTCPRCRADTGRSNKCWNCGYDAAPALVLSDPKQDRNTRRWSRATMWMLSVLGIILFAALVVWNVMRH